MYRDRPVAVLNAMNCRPAGNSKSKVDDLALKIFARGGWLGGPLIRKRHGGRWLRNRVKADVSLEPLAVCAHDPTPSAEA